MNGVYAQVDVFEKRGRTTPSPASSLINQHAFVHTFPMVIGRRGVIGLQEVNHNLFIYMFRCEMNKYCRQGLLTV